MGSAGQSFSMTFALPQLSLSRMHRLLVLGLLVSLPAHAVWADDRPASKSLWQTALSVPSDNLPPMPRRPWVIRSREIALNLPLFQVLKDAGARPHPKITLEFFDGASSELDITSTVSRINDSATIRGTFKPPSKGSFTFVVNGNLLVGTMQLGDRLYKTEHIVNGRLQLLEVDPGKLPPE